MSTLVSQPVITGATHHWRAGASTVEARHKPLLGDIKLDPGGAKAIHVSMGESKLWPAVATTKPNPPTHSAKN